MHLCLIISRVLLKDFLPRTAFLFYVFCIKSPLTINCSFSVQALKVCSILISYYTFSSPSYILCLKDLFIFVKISSTKSFWNILMYIFFTVLFGTVYGYNFLRSYIIAYVISILSHVPSSCNLLFMCSNFNTYFSLRLFACLLE